MPCRVPAIFALTFLTGVFAFGQKLPSGTIYYTGQLDGFAGSWTSTAPANWYLYKDYGNPGAILVGLETIWLPILSVLPPQCFRTGLIRNRAI